MNNPSQPIPPPDPYKGYKIEGIQKQKPDKEGSEPPATPPHEHSWLGGYLILVFQRMLEFFSKKQRPVIASDAFQAIKEHLLAFRQILEQLKENDCSQDVPYLRSLSDQWLLLIEDNFTFKRGSAFAISFRTLFREVQDYPKGQQHTLGYYITEYPGADWLPFPFMELIQGLHREYQQNPRESHLAKWSQEIEHLVGLLGEMNLNQTV